MKKRWLGISAILLMAMGVVLAVSLPVWSSYVVLAPIDTAVWQNGQLVMDTTRVMPRSKVLNGETCTTT